MNGFAKTPAPPYYAVIFTSTRTEGDGGYKETAERMLALVSKEPGFLGAESVRGEDGFGITVSYWDSLDSIKKWKENPDHAIARKLGKEKWYRGYSVRVCRVERDDGFERQSRKTI